MKGWDNSWTEADQGDRATVFIATILVASNYLGERGRGEHRGEQLLLQL